MSITTELKFTLTGGSGGDTPGGDTPGGDTPGGDTPSGGDTPGDQQDSQDTSQDYYYDEDDGSAVPETGAYTTTDTSSPNTGVYSASHESTRATIFMAVFFAVVIASLIIMLIFRSKKQKAIIFERSSFHLSSRRRIMATSALVLAFATLSGLAVSNLNQDWSTQAATETELDITLSPQNPTFSDAARGKFSIKSQTITVSPSTSEYDLYISFNDNFCIKNTTNCLNPAAGSLGSSTNTILQSNQWGISSSNGTATDKIWAGIPTTSTKITNSGTSTTVYYGINLGSDLADGEYTAKVTYKAVAKATPEPEPTTVTMQEFECSSLSESGETKTLVDARDNQQYTVYRIPTNSTATNVAGKCIMTRDLNLGAVASVSGSASTIVANGKMTLSKTDSTFSSNSGESVIVIPTSTAVVENNTGNWNADDKYDNKQYITSGTGDYAGRGYYSWGAAMVACPKGWRLPTGDELNSATSTWNASTTGITKAANNDLNTIKSAPWSFTLSGHYDGEFSLAGSYGYYWSSDNGSSAGAGSLILSAENGLRRRTLDRKYGHTVRCIYGEADTPTPEPAVATMQEFDASTSLPNIGDSTTLTDTRDNKIYTVKRLPDGKVWMVQNLTLGSDGAKTLTSTDTNIDNNTTYYLPPAGKQGDITSASTLTSTTAADFSTSGNNQAKTQFRTKDTSVANDSDTGYYDFYTATLGYPDSSTSGSSTRDICPKGWRLPKTTDAGTTVSAITSVNDFAYLATKYNTNASWTGTATTDSYYTVDSTIQTGIHSGVATNSNDYAGFSYAGYWSGANDSASYVGSNGSYWSSSVYDATSSYRLSLSTSYIRPQFYNSKNGGLAVRCVAK